MARSAFYYDKYSLPPLRNQFKAGYLAYKSPYLKRLNGATIIVTANPYPEGTMQHKEWQRGYDHAYFN
jgi:hypothetical protein